MIHNRFGEGTVYAYIIVCPETIMRLSYTSIFTDGSLSAEYLH